MKFLFALFVLLALVATAPAPPLTADVDTVRMVGLRLLAPGIEPSERAPSCTPSNNVAVTECQIGMTPKGSGAGLGMTCRPWGFRYVTDARPARFVRKCTLTARRSAHKLATQAAMRPGSYRLACSPA